MTLSQIVDHLTNLLHEWEHVVIGPVTKQPSGMRSFMVATSEKAGGYRLTQINASTHHDRTALIMRLATGRFILLVHHDIRDADHMVRYCDKLWLGRQPASLSIITLDPGEQAATEAERLTLSKRVEALNTELWPRYQFPVLYPKNQRTKH